MSLCQSFVMSHILDLFIIFFFHFPKRVKGWARAREVSPEPERPDSFLEKFTMAGGANNEEAGGKKEDVQKRESLWTMLKEKDFTVDPSKTFYYRVRCRMSLRQRKNLVSLGISILKEWKYLMRHFFKIISIRSFFYLCGMWMGICDRWLSFSNRT